MLVEDGRIREIFSDAGNRPAVGDAEVIDLHGAYLMPGLWDVHIHPDYHSLADMSLPEQTTLFGNRLQAALLESGIVGLRCAGAHSFMDVAWKRAFGVGSAPRTAPVRVGVLPDDHGRALPAPRFTRSRSTGRTASSRRSASRSRTVSITSS